MSQTRDSSFEPSLFDAIFKTHTGQRKVIDAAPAFVPQWGARSDPIRGAAIVSPDGARYSAGLAWPFTARPLAVDALIQCGLVLSSSAAKAARDSAAIDGGVAPKTTVVA